MLLRDRVPPGQTLAKGFPVLTYGDTPQISQAQWQLQITGLAEPKTFTWADLMALPQSDFDIDFHCVTRWSKLDMPWRGVRVTDLMAQVELRAGATAVMQHCYGGYTTNLQLEDFLRPENFLAHEVYGEPLSPNHGGPLRLVVPHLYAWKSGKWLHKLEFLAQDEPGFWERNGYHMRGEPFAEERYSA
ncbi:MAG: sulfite oxidase-like oxidoreductase [Synechococcales cyanobacterium RM1_1_8]|nr:sulfite oxidase-like oxidoreductase [Synechococcales cyanobacterium RM1_1_8]